MSGSAREHPGWGVVDLEAGWVYMPTPRCASTSILRALERHFGLERSRNVYYRRWPLTASAGWIAEHAESRGMTVWAVCRPPWERLVSLWSGLVKPGDADILTGHPLLAEYAGCSFERFAWAVCAADELDRHALPLADFLCFEGRLLPNRLVPMERLAEAWAGFVKEWCYPPLENENPGNYGSWRSHFTPRLLAAVRRRYRRDMALLRRGRILWA